LEFGGELKEEKVWRRGFTPSCPFQCYRET